MDSIAVVRKIETRQKNTQYIFQIQGKSDVGSPQKEIQTPINFKCDLKFRVEK